MTIECMGPGRKFFYFWQAKRRRRVESLCCAREINDVLIPSCITIFGHIKMQELPGQRGNGKVGFLICKKPLKINSTRVARRSEKKDWGEEKERIG